MALLGVREEGLELGFVGFIELVEVKAEVLVRGVHVGVVPALAHNDVCLCARA